MGGYLRAEEPVMKQPTFESRSNIVGVRVVVVVARIVAFVVLGASVAAINVGCANDRQVISQADNMHAGLKPAVMNDAQLADYLQKVGDRIIDSAKELDKEGYGPKSHKSEETKWMFSNNMKFHF